MDRKPIRSWTRKDFKVETFRGHGPGGQHRNKTDSCVRITHIESGLSACGTADRSQRSNREFAFRTLAAKIVRYYGIADKRKERGESGALVRTYHQPDNRVIDHKSGFRQSYDAVIRSGDIGPMIEMRRAAFATERE